MNPSFVQALASETLFLILIVSAPVLAVSLFVGLAISILQATTQVNEMTLAYIPKIVAIYVTLILFSGFIVERLVNFANKMFTDFSRFTI